VTPEAAQYVEKANKLLSAAEIALAAGLREDAGRDAYMAAFHAAQAFIFQRAGRPAKTHKGVHAEFFRLIRGYAFAPELRLFLSRAYDLKSIADYEVGPAAQISQERAESALAAARRFIDGLVALIAEVDRPA
jgi:uncharacterized protein (UPF0332 family)